MPRKPTFDRTICRLSALLLSCCASTVLAQKLEEVAPTDEAIVEEDVGTETPENEEASTSTEVDEDWKPEIITVTGSRIKRSEFTSSAPIEIITKDRSVLAGLLNSSEILQGSTFAAGQQIDGSFSAYVTDGGPGANEVNLRGLGGQRALVLVNGKRWMPTGVRGSVYNVDLTAMPDSVINRYEILKDGASSVYGADAIAGVVNAITRENIDGGTVNVSYTYPQIGDGQELMLDGVWGKTADNWSFSVGLSYLKEERVKQWDLDYAKCDTRPRLTDQEGDGVIDNTDPETGEQLCFGMIYGFAVSPFGWARFDPSLANPDPSNPNYDQIINGDYGIPYYTTVPETPLDNSGEFYSDTRNPGLNDVQPESDIFSLNSFGTYDFALAGRNATAYYEFYYNRRETDANSGHRQFFPTVPANNPYNPFGLYGPLGGVGEFTATPVVPTYEILKPGFDVDIERRQVFAGLKGDISADWTYDVYLGHGYSDGSYGGEVLLADRVEASLDVVVDTNSNVDCADLVNFPDCVPINLFTEDALLNGILPGEAVDFLVKDSEGTTVYKGTSLAGYATGPLFEMPAGSVSAVFGAEYRKEYIRDVPDPDSISGNFYASAAAGITTGEDTVQEVYAEFEIPLFEGLPGTEELVFNASGRYTDYDSYGDDTTYRVALDWHITKSLRLRGTRGTSFRAPDLYEQFLGDQTGFVDGLADPCKQYQETSDPGDPVYDNCESQGLPDEYFDGNEGILIVTGGADTLEAEKSDTYTYGFVWQPDEIGFAFGINWWNIDVENTVESLGASTIIGRCYDSINFASPFCSRIGPREDNGTISVVDASFVNIGKQHASGFDVDFAYEKAFPKFDLGIDITYTYTDELSEDVLGESIDYEGKFAFPYHSWESDLFIVYREWRFNWRMEFIGDTAEEPVYDPGTTNIDRVNWTPSMSFHNFSAEYTWGDMTLIGIVRNAFDKEPPLVADGSGSLSATRVFNTLPGSGYPLLGRTFIAKVGYEF